MDSKVWLEKCRNDRFPVDYDSMACFHGVVLYAADKGVMLMCHDDCLVDSSLQ